MTSTSHLRTPSSHPDPMARLTPAFLEEVTGEEALAWVRERNRRTEDVLATPPQTDLPSVAELEGEILEILDNPDRIPMPKVRGEYAYNFWTDGDHPRGLWRRQPFADYLAGKDTWETLIDVDALAAEEEKSWVWHGANVLYPTYDRALVSLSDGGSDADVTREFDLVTKTWVKNGFFRPEGKGSLSWISRDLCWLTQPMSEESTSPSGYPLQARLLRRGQALEESTLVLQGGPEAMGVWAGITRDRSGIRSLIEVREDFYTADRYVVEGIVQDAWGPGADELGKDSGLNETGEVAGSNEAAEESQGTQGAEKATEQGPGKGTRLGKATEPGSIPSVRLLPVPRSSEGGVWNEWALVWLREEWDHGGVVYPAGALLALDLAGLWDDPEGAPATVLFEPTSHEVLEDTTVTRDSIVLTTIRDVISAVTVLTPPADETGEWNREPMSIGSEGAGQPGIATVSLIPFAAAEDNRLWAISTGYAQPSSLWLVEVDAGPGSELEHGVGSDTPPQALTVSSLVFGSEPELDVKSHHAAQYASSAPFSPLDSTTGSKSDAHFQDGTFTPLNSESDPSPESDSASESGPDLTDYSAQLVRQAPHLYDANDVVVTQHFATSPDGTRIPYFQVQKEEVATPAPALLYGYGGFNVSLLPAYAPAAGKAWIERGGIYVVANIRGGGEYGPTWHQAALKGKRHRAYEDFVAVARDLVARGVTTPQQLGSQGGSNGGLLMGNMYTHYPSDFGAILCQVPLLDMGRYHTLLAGHSWMAEYGDPTDPRQWEHLQTFSPVHLFDPETDYPPLMITTSTKDDRVHPGHARSLGYLAEDAGKDILYCENIEGGHAGAADNRQRAHNQALGWAFLWGKLGAI